MRDIFQVSLRDLVPESIRSDAKVSAAIDAIDSEIQAVSQLCVVPSILARIDLLDTKVLDHLAWQFNAKSWRDTWPISLKRSVIKAIIQVKAKLGTRYAVEQAVQSLGSSVSIQEWWQFEPPKTPHTFDIIVTLNDQGGEVPDAQIQEDVIRLIQDSKPVRSQFEFTLAQQGQGDIAMFGVSRVIEYFRFDFEESV